MQHNVLQHRIQKMIHLTCRRSARGRRIGRGRSGFVVTTQFRAAVLSSQTRSRAVGALRRSSGGGSARLGSVRAARAAVPPRSPGAGCRCAAGHKVAPAAGGSSRRGSPGRPSLLPCRSRTASPGGFCQTLWAKLLCLSPGWQLHVETSSPCWAAETDCGVRAS